MVGSMLIKDVSEIIFPPQNTPALMAEYMDQAIPKDAIVETWEPEMGFLTNHKYHFPPQILLDAAVGYIWRGGAAPSTSYNFIETTKPEYVLVGQFGRYSGIYNISQILSNYQLVNEVGYYSLYQLRK